MKKYSVLCLVWLLLVGMLVAGAGCKELPVELPGKTTPSSSVEPSATIPEESVPEGQEPTTTSQETTSEPEPSTVPPESTSEPGPEPEATEPLIHSSAYIKFEGIDGESISLGHEDWSEIVAFSQAFGKPGSMDTTSRSRGDVVVEDIVVVKQVDKSSPKLAEAMCKGQLFTKVEIHLTGPSEGSTCEGTFYAYELKNVMITSYKVTGSNPLAYALVAPAPDLILPYSGPFIVQAVDAPMEEISLNFEEIKVTYTECDSTGKSKGNVEFSWKVEEGLSDY
jgi:type VI secretion system secreted protein Hcp